MKKVILRFAPHRAVIAGVALSLFIAGLESLLLWLRGAQADDMHSLLGQAVIWIAKQVTPAPSMTKAGSDRNDLIYSLFFYSYMLFSLGFAVLLWLRTRHVRLLAADKPGKAADTIWLLLQLAIGLVVNSTFLYIVAAELAFLYRLRKSLLWLLPLMLLHSGIAICSAATCARGAWSRAWSG